MTNKELDPTVVAPGSGDVGRCAAGFDNFLTHCVCPRVNSLHSAAIKNPRH